LAEHQVTIFLVVVGIQ